MANILEFLPLRYTYSSGILSKNGSKRALHHLHGARIPWRTRCSITASSIEAYHDSEPAITTRRSANYQPSSWSHVLAESMDEKDNEFVIYKEIRERFSNHLWLDVLSKCDLLEESPVVYVTEDVNCDDYELAKYRKMGPDGALRVSVKSEMGLDEWEIQMTILKKLEEEVRYMLDDENLEPQSLLELVHDIDRLGISYKYRGTIREALDRLKSLKEATTEITKDLHLSALYFRLLRQHGYEASPDIFERFRDRSGNFGNLGRSLAKDVRGILSLYEASHLAYEGEETLQEAKSFTSLHLKSLKELVDSNMSEEIKHALELPYHHRMRRLEAWWNIETCAKRNGKNQILLELAKLDFNMVQSVLQGDLQDVLRWWKAVGLADKLSFARDRLMESFFWTVGMAFEPQYSKCRRGLTKALALITVLDDIYDVYGSLHELEQLTEAVVRWDIDAVKDFPDYLKLFFLAVYNTVNELAYDTLREQGEVIIPHLTKAWADLCKSFLQEAKWNHEKVTPTFDEYIQNAWISSSGAVLLVHSYFLVTEKISKEAIHCLDNHHGILQWPCTILRLYNDFSTLSTELERGEVTNALTCYMHETGQSEELTGQHISQMIEECWMKMNKELISPSPFEENFTEIAVDLARIALCQYQYGDAHSSPGVIARNRIFSVILEPIQLLETAQNTTTEWKSLLASS